MTTAPSASVEDARWMARALSLARTRLGKVAPNPAVGCIIVRDGVVLAEGATGQGGRPHAEEAALAAAGQQVDLATAYITLEPCSARTSGAPSCAQRLVDAGVMRVVAACQDPHPAAAHGLSVLGAAGVEAQLGLMREEAEALNCGFFKRVRTGRPWLAIDGDASVYDAAYDLLRGESFEAALDRLGAQGMTRVHVLPGTALAAQLKARGLVDGGGD